MEKNIIHCTITLENGDVYRQAFGVVGAQIWKVYGPFWENTSYAPPPRAMESYYQSLPAGNSESESLTILRQFHLNMTGRKNISKSSCSGMLFYHKI